MMPLTFRAIRSGPFDLSRIRRAAELRALPRDRLRDAEGTLLSQRVAALLERFSGFRTNSGFVIQPIGNPLMMDTRRFDRRADGHVKIQDVENRLQRRADDSRSARRADHQLGTALSEHDGRRHTAERSFVGLKRIGLVADQPVNISDIAVNRKVVDFIVEHDPRSCREQFGTEPRVDRLSARDRVAESIHNAKVRCAALFGIVVIVAVETRRLRFFRGDSPANPLGVILCCQLAYGNVNEIRIAKKLRPIRKRVLHRLRDQVQIRSRVVLQLTEIVSFEDIEHL